MSDYSINKPYTSSRSDIQNVLRDSRLPALIWGILIYFSALYSQLPMLPTWFEFMMFTGSHSGSHSAALVCRIRCRSKTLDLFCDARMYCLGVCIIHA